MCCFTHRSVIWSSIKTAGYLNYILKFGLDPKHHLRSWKEFALAQWDDFFKKKLYSDVCSLPTAISIKNNLPVNSLHEEFLRKITIWPPLVHSSMILGIWPLNSHKSCFCMQKTCYNLWLSNTCKKPKYAEIKNPFSFVKAENTDSEASLSRSDVSPVKDWRSLMWLLWLSWYLTW